MTVLNNKFGFLILTVCIFSTTVLAEEKRFLTVEELTKNDYVQLTGLQISELMKKHVIEVIDIETDAVSISRRGNGNAEDGMERKFDDLKTDKTLYFLDTRLLARAPPLQGEIKRSVKGDALVSTDGVRTYQFSVYEKQGKIYAARDIDHGNVFYEVKVK